MDHVVASAKGEDFLSRMALNDNKAGMEGLDRDKINKIIMDSSKVQMHARTRKWKTGKEATEGRMLGLVLKREYNWN